MVFDKKYLHREKIKNPTSPIIVFVPLFIKISFYCHLFTNLHMRTSLDLSRWDP